MRMIAGQYRRRQDATTRTTRRTQDSEVRRLFKFQKLVLTVRYWYSTLAVSILRVILTIHRNVVVRRGGTHTIPHTPTALVSSEHNPIYINPQRSKYSCEEFIAIDAETRKCLSRPGHDAVPQMAPPCASLSLASMTDTLYE
jgi:hypothetical protein